MTAGYMKKMISIKGWSCGRTGHQHKIQSMRTPPAIETSPQTYEVGRNNVHLLWM